MSQHPLEEKNVATRSSMKISSPNTEGISIVNVESQGSKIVTEMDFDKALLTLFKLKAKDY